MGTSIFARDGGGGAGTGDVSGPGSSTTNAIVTWADTSGELVQNTPNILYNSAYQGPASDEPARPVMVLDAGITIDPTYTHLAAVGNSMEGINSQVTYTPSGASTGAANMRGIFSSIHATGTNSLSVLTGNDVYSSVDGAQGYTAIIGSTVVATTQGASTGSGGIIGGTFSGVQQDAGATTPLVVSLQADPTNGGSRTMLGTVTTLKGVNITGMSVAGTVATTNRYGLYLDAMAGNAGTLDFAIYSLATQPSLINGTLVLGRAATTAGVLAITNTGNSNLVLLKAGATAATYSFFFPVDDGNDGEVLSTNGSGVTSWVPNSGGGATTALDNLASVAINAALVPATSDAIALGSASKQWSDVFLAEGGVINFDNGDVTITQTGNVLAIAGGTTVVDSLASVSVIVPSANDGTSLGSTVLQWSDLFLAEGGVINWDNGDATITQAGNVVTLAGASLALGSTVSSYNGVATVRNGVPSAVAVVDLTAQSAAISATTIYAVPTTGMYRLSWVATVTTAAQVTSVLGGTTAFQTIYTDADDSVVKTSAGNSVNNSISASNTTGAQVSGVQVAYAKASTNLQYAFDYTSSGTPAMAYNLHITVEAL